MTESKPARKFVLLGKSGAGKSSSGNIISGGHQFKTESSPDSITAECTTKSGKVDGRESTIIDTPGIFGTCREEEDIRSAIISSIVECAPAVDAFVIVLKVERYTRQEKEILDKIVEYCGEDIFKHAVILFTHGEELEGQTIEEFVQKSSPLQELVNKCGGRCHVIDNKHWNDCDLGYRSNKFHVKNLLNTIDKMVEKNGHYTNELILKIEEEIQEEMNSMLIVNLSTEEKRESAKKIVLKKILIRSAGVATGTLIGAFLGIGVAVASVAVLLKAASLKVVAKAIGTAAGRVSVKVAFAAAAGGGAAAGTAAAAAAAGAAGTAAAAAAAVAAAVEAGLAAGATGAAVGAAAAAAGTVAVEAGVATGAAVGATAAAAGTVAMETGVAAGAGIGAAAGSGIAAGVVFGAAALAGAIRGGITGFKATKEADSVSDAIKAAAKANFEKAKEIVKKAEKLPSNVYKKFQ